MTKLSVPELLQHTKCNACSLAKEGCANPTRISNSRGSMSARIAIVGESPTEGDVRKKSTLTGASGDLVTSITKSLGIPASDLYWSHALMCNYAKGNKPTKTSIAACHDRLIHELRQLPNLKVVVALGGSACQSLTGRDKITKEIYNVYWNDELGCFVVPSYHPGMCFVNIEAFEDLVWAIQRALSLLDKPKTEIDAPKIKIRVARTTGEAEAILRRISLINKPTWVAIDWETDGLNPMIDPSICIGFSWVPYEAWIIPWATGELDKPCKEWDFAPTHLMRSFMRKISENPNVKAVFHNGDYDVRVAYHQASALFTISADTLLTDYALDERGGSDQLEGTGGGTRIGSHRLKSSAKRYLNVPDWESDIKQYLPSKTTPYSNIPRPRLHQYLGYDCVYTLLLREKHDELLVAEEPSRKGWWGPKECVENLLIPAQNEIIRMEIGGIFINRLKASIVLDDMNERLNAMNKEIQARAKLLGWKKTVTSGRKGHKVTTEVPFNVRSDDDRRVLIYEIMKIPLTKDLRTDLNGKRIDTAFPTGSSVLTKLSGRDPIFATMVAFKSLDKRRGTYVVSPLENSSYDGNVHGKFALASARTGRLTSYDPNLQNIEPSTKEFYEPDLGDEFYNFDYRQLEVRVAAWYSRDKNLIEATRSDIHGEIAKKVFAPIYAEIAVAESKIDLMRICGEYKVLNPTMLHEISKPYPTFEEFRKACRNRLRDAAKPIIFGVIYGREAYSLANGPLMCSEKEAQKYIDNLFAQFPDLYKWLEQQKKDVEKYGWIETPTGRRRRFSFITDEFIKRILKQTINAPVQGFASDVCLTAFKNIAPELRERGWGRPLLLVHDAIGFSLKIEFASLSVPWIKHKMETAYVDDEVLFAVEAKKGPNYGTLKEVKLAA